MDYKDAWDKLKKHITEYKGELQDFIDAKAMLPESVRFAEGSITTCNMILSMMLGAELIINKEA